MRFSLSSNCLGQVGQRLQVRLVRGLVGGVEQVALAHQKPPAVSWSAGSARRQRALDEGSIAELA